jgi:hypothetical protein
MDETLRHGRDSVDPTKLLDHQKPDHYRLNTAKHSSFNAILDYCKGGLPASCCTVHRTVRSKRLHKKSAGVRLLPLQRCLSVIK